MNYIRNSFCVLGPAALLSVIGSCSSPEQPTESAAQGLTVCHSTVVDGIDVSEFQGTIDWNLVHSQGIEFAIARIGDGNYHDTQFATNWAGIQAAGMIRGAYLFFRPTESAASQAAMISSAVGMLGPGDLPVTIDVECMCPFLTSGACDSHTAGCTDPATATSVLRDLVNQVQASSGRVPMIYTGAWFWDGSTYLNQAANFGSNPLWVSGYVTGCVTVPSGWTDWQIWQWTDAAPLNGFSGGVPDGDRFNGTLADLQALANGTVTTPTTWAGQFVAQSFPYASVGPIMINAGSSAPAWIRMRNTGTSTWDGNTRLAATQPRDRTDPFAGPDWVDSSRPASVPAGMTVAPGGSYQFQWTFWVPATMAPGLYTEYFGMVEDGTVWFSDPGQGGPPDGQLEAIVQVLPVVSPPPDAGTHDARASDAGLTDVANPTDVALTDVGTGDTSASDAARSDAGAPDSTGHDSGADVAHDAAIAADGGTVMTELACGCNTAGRSRSNKQLGMMLLTIAAAFASRRRATRSTRERDAAR